MAYDKTTDLLDVQADVLTTDTSANTKIAKLKQLKTETKIPTKAINALNDQLGNATASATDALQRVVSMESDMTAVQTDVAALKAGGVGQGTGTLTDSAVFRLMRLLGKDVLAWTGFARDGVAVELDDNTVSVPMHSDPADHLPNQVTGVKFANAVPEDTVPVFWDTTAADLTTAGDTQLVGEFGHGYFSSAVTPTVTLRVTAPVVPTVYGVVLKDENGSTEDWVRIDQKYNTVDFDDTVHKVYANMHPVTVDGQEMVEIPVTYVKTEVLADGPYAGKTCWWTADYPVDGFHPHPAFIDSDGYAKPLQVAAWIASRGVDDVPQSVPTAVSVSAHWDKLGYTNIAAAVDLRNTTGTVSGWHSWSIYTQQLIARLLLTEFGTPDVHILMVDGVKWNGSARVEWRGIHDPFGLAGGATLRFWLTGLTVDSSGKYVLLANDGSGEMVTTTVAAPGNASFMRTVSLVKGAKYDFGDLFINSQLNSTIGATPWMATQNASANTAPQVMFTGGQYSGPFALTYFSQSSTDSVGFRFARHVRVE